MVTVNNMALNWSKWGLEFWQSLMRHVGTAGMTWIGLGIKDGVVDWKGLGVAIMVGAVLPTVFTFLQKNPIPELESVTITTKTTVTSQQVEPAPTGTPPPNTAGVADPIYDSRNKVE